MKLRSIVQEVQAYEAARARQQSCSLSTVEPATDWMKNGVPHAGVAAHICTASQNHAGNCKCECGHQWRGKK